MRILSLTAVVATFCTSVFARTSVYMISNNNDNVQQQTDSSNIPQVSMNAFSMFYSHMMDSTSNHPALLLQDNIQQQAMQDVQQISRFLPATRNSLFEKKVSSNLMVIVSGAQTPQELVSTQDTSFYVSNDNEEDYSVMTENALGDLAESDEKVTITTYKNQKIEIRQGQKEAQVTGRPIEESFEYFKRDFAEFDTSIFNIENEADKIFVTEVEDVREMHDSDVRVIELGGLQVLAQEYGIESTQYKQAQLILQDLFEKFIIPMQEQADRAVSIFVFTPVVTLNQKRALPSSTLMAGKAQCFKTAGACKNSTDSCSGNGQCTLLATDCYTCSCKSGSYVGESCQYINAVGDFQLLFWTSVLLIVITASVVVCVYQSGNIVDGGIIMTQSLPKQD